jgi:hypothetical protein
VGADTELVKRHVATLVEEACAAKIPTDVLGRLLLQQAVELWKRERSLDDIASELKFTADGLDPDADFEFMRP